MLVYCVESATLWSVVQVHFDLLFDSFSDNHFSWFPFNSSLLRVREGKKKKKEKCVIFPYLTSPFLLLLVLKSLSTRQERHLNISK